MDTTKEKAREEKIRQIQVAGAEVVLKAEKERLGIDIVPVFDEEKILLDCTLSDLTVIHLRTDYRNFTLGSPGIFPGPGIWSYHEIFCLHLFSCLEIEYQLDDSVGVALCGQMLQDQSDDHKYLLQ